ncbi:hypothetical protein GCM10028806_28280 [Spirosoma terrae]|uniref:Uncharacterized protein n=1 Tax=Spirosoma terrae TaxID=1968276 RepID=A0A6L9L9S7_9BACT|nr:hypothetical protein [Spirosoma terrae]NDU97210.1 hypothetical protein [Spirosoma terrae]
MERDQKIANLLNRIQYHSINVPFDLSIYLRELGEDTNEIDEILKRVIDENFIIPATAYGNNFYYLTHAGKRMGLSNSYVNDQLKKDQEIIKLKDRERILAERENEDRKWKNLNNYITIISALGTLAIGVWNTSLNNDMDDVLQNLDTVKLKLDSLTYNIEILKKNSKSSTMDSSKKSEINKTMSTINKENKKNLPVH